MDENNHLLLPLLPSNSTSKSSSTFFSSSTTNVSTAAATTTTIDDEDIKCLISSSSSITLRFLSIICIGIISIWANYEASKGFSIEIVNDAAKDSPAGKRFFLFYMSNDKATRIVQHSSFFVENVLYYNNTQTRKDVHHVTLRLAPDNLTNVISVVQTKKYDFVITVCPSVFDGGRTKREIDEAFKGLVLRGMARTWLWNNGGSMAPQWLLDGMVQYIAVLGVAGGGSFGGGSFRVGENNSKDPTHVAKYLDYCERGQKGFIQRLNQVLMDGWDDRTVQNAFKRCR